MNFGTKIRTILAVATCLNTALMATDVAQFHNETVNLVYRIISVILNFIVVACVTWYNNDYTPEACEGTGYTRMLKTGEDGLGVVVEDFIEEGDEDE
jgi:SPP1 family holin